MLRLVTPVLIEQLLHVLVFYVDMWLAGKYLAGQSPLAAINLVSYVMWMVFTLFAVVAIAATAMTARFIGALDFDQASRMMNQSLLVGSVIMLITMVLGRSLIDDFVGWMQLQGAAHQLATRYLQIVLFALPGIMLLEVGIAALRGAGDMVSGLVIMAIVNTVNIVVSAGLLLGVGPLPTMDWEGLAYGTACGQLVGGLIVLGLLVRGRAGLKLHLYMLRPDLDLIRRLLKIGVPGGADALAVVACHLWFLTIINSLGTIAAAAHGIGVRIEALAFMPGLAFNMAAATLAGQYLGARDYRRASRSVVMACAVGGGLMTSAGVLFYFGAVPLSEFFQGGRSTDVTQLAAQLVQVVAFTTPALAIAMILSGGLRGAGDTRWPLLFTFIGLLGIRIPLTYLLAYDAVHIPGTQWVVSGFDFGVLGAWYAMVTDVTIRCLLVLARFWQGGWRRIRV